MAITEKDLKNIEIGSVLVDSNNDEWEVLEIQQSYSPNVYLCKHQGLVYSLQCFDNQWMGAVLFQRGQVIDTLNDPSAYVRPQAEDNSFHMTYDDLLVELDNWQIGNGIRKHCTEVCKGRCCQCTSSGGKCTCLEVEERRVTCSAYLCPDLRYRVVADSSRRNKIYLLTELLQEKIRKVLPKKSNVYFSSHGKQARKEFLIHKDMVSLLLPTERENEQIATALVGFKPNPNNCM